MSTNLSPFGKRYEGGSTELNIDTHLIGFFFKEKKKSLLTVTVTCSKVTTSVTLSLETENESSHVRIMCTSMCLEIRNEALVILLVYVCVYAIKE